MNDHVNLGFQVEVVQGDALTYQADVLALKDTPHFSGIDRRVSLMLQTQGLYPQKQVLRDGSYLIPGRKVTHTKYILYNSIAPETIQTGSYVWLRDLGRRTLENLKETQLPIRHLAMTIHGAGLGMDEVEALRALLLGLNDAYEESLYPPTLEQITFVERDARRAALLQEALLKFLSTQSPGEEATANNAAVFEKAPAPPQAMIAGPESFTPEFRQPEADDTTPHIFVAMPFKDSYDDQFYLAIQPCVKDCGLLCERMDLDTFTGDIMDRMFERIQGAKLLIGLLDGGNPNVYLEVGYAWGVKTKTVLIAHKDEPLPFDVRGHRVLIYDKIYKLREMLQDELARLLV